MTSPRLVMVYSDPIAVTYSEQRGLELQAEHGGHLVETGPATWTIFLETTEADQTPPELQRQPGHVDRVDSIGRKIGVKWEDNRGKVLPGTVVG